MRDQPFTGITNDPEPFAIIRTDTTVTVHIGVGLPVPCQFSVQYLDLAFLGCCQAARRYSLIRPLTVRRFRIGRSMGITTSGSWSGGCWLRLWCGRCALKCSA